MGKNKMEGAINLEFNNEELAQYLEAMAEDISKGMKDIASLVIKNRSLELSMPPGFLKKMEKIHNAMQSLADKSSDIEVSIPEMERMISSVDGMCSMMGDMMKKMDKPMEMPDINVPAPDVQVNVDLGPLEKKFDAFLLTLSQTPLQAELTNLDQMPMVFGQHAAKELSEATPLIHNKTLTDGDTWYDVSITGPTKSFAVQCLTPFDIDIKFSSGASDPYWTVKSGSSFSLNGYVPTIYVRSAQAGVIAQIIETH